WVSDLAELAGQGLTGVFYNCEFADSLPTRLVTYVDGWQELMVSWPQDAPGPMFVQRPVQNQTLLEEIERWRIPRVRRYRAEVSLQISRWMSEVAAVFERGFVLTIAYGFEAETLYHTNRLTG